MVWDIADPLPGFESDHHRPEGVSLIGLGTFETPYLVPSSQPQLIIVRGRLTRTRVRYIGSRLMPRQTLGPLEADLTLWTVLRRTQKRIANIKEHPMIGKLRVPRSLFVLSSSRLTSVDLRRIDGEKSHRAIEALFIRHEIDLRESFIPSHSSSCQWEPLPLRLCGVASGHHTQTETNRAFKLERRTTVLARAGSWKDHG
jgi:hypothetical protein